MKKTFTGWLRSRKAAWYRKTLRRKICRYYRKIFFTAPHKYSLPAIPGPNSYIDAYTIFENTLPALLTMSAINFFKFGITLHAKKYAEEMWYCRKLIRKAARVEDESMERTAALLKARFGKNTQRDYAFAKIPGSENSTLEMVWSGYDNPENLEKTEIEKQMEEAHTSLLRESAKWEAEQTTARWKDVFAYITEIVSDHITKEDDPQFGPYDTPPCMRFLRWWD